MMLEPVLNGASVAKEWQPMSALTCTLPNSFCTIFIDEKKGRSGQPVHRPGGRGGTALRSSLIGISRCSDRAAAGVVVDEAAVERNDSPCSEAVETGSNARGSHSSRNLVIPALTTAPVYSPAMGSGPLPP